MTGQLSGQLTITASQLDAKALVLPALTPLLETNTKLILNLMVNDRQIDLIADSVDIAIRAGRLKDSNLVARSLGTIDEVLVVSPKYSQRYGIPSLLSELSKHRIIMFTSFEQPKSLTMININGIQETVSLQIGAITDNVEMVVQLALSGFGIARLPRSTVRKSLLDGSLIEIMKDFHLPQIQMYAITVKRDLQPRKVAIAIKEIQQFILNQKTGLEYDKL